MNKNQLLISRYVDRELSDAEVTELANVLRADPGLVDQLVVDSFVHSQLVNWLNQNNGQNHEGLVAASERCNPLASDDIFIATKLQGAFINSRAVPPQYSGVNRAKSQLRTWGSIAAAVLIAVTISTAGYFIVSRPTIVGQLTESNGTQWTESNVPMGTGALLQKGQNLVLAKGSAVITFASGAKVYLEGPTSLRLSSVNELQLISGRIAARVPRQAVGFTVTNSLGRVVDLGTAFMLSLNAEKSFELYVFEGLVELQLDERFGAAAHQPVRVAQVHGLSFDVCSGDVAPVKFEHGKSMPF